MINWSTISQTDINTIFVVGTGPSLDGFDFKSLQGRGFIIAVNDAWQFMPFADVWFTIDPWGLNGKQTPRRDFRGSMWAAVPDDFGTKNAACNTHRITPLPTIKFLHRVPFSGSTEEDFRQWGLAEDNGSINSTNSGYGALNFAYHMRPKRIVLLGIDASSGYFFDHEKETRSLKHLPWVFESAIPQLQSANIKIINGSHISKIHCFQQMTPQQAISSL